jgi:Flp pilus assembly protein TadD
MLLNVDLDKAMADCQGALRRLPTDWGALDGRAFINLRQGASDKAIADFDQALKLQTKNAWPYYGRGLAELKQGRADAAKADIAAATAINPNIAKAAGRYGLAP